MNYFCIMMLTEKNILIDNAELVKKIEDNSSSQYSFFKKTETPQGNEYDFRWWKYKNN